MGGGTLMMKFQSLGRAHITDLPAPPPLQIIAANTDKLNTSATLMLEFIASLAVKLIANKNYKLEDWKVVGETTSWDKSHLFSMN